MQKMYSPNNNDCKDCICPNCGNFQTSDCLEESDSCEACMDGYCVGHYWWDTEDVE